MIHFKLWVELSYAVWHPRHLTQTHTHRHIRTQTQTHTHILTHRQTDTDRQTDTLHPPKKKNNPTPQQKQHLTKLSAPTLTVTGKKTLITINSASS